MFLRSHSMSSFPPPSCSEVYNSLKTPCLGSVCNPVSGQCVQQFRHSDTLQQKASRQFLIKLPWPWWPLGD